MRSGMGAAMMEVAHRYGWHQRGASYRTTNIQAMKTSIATRELVHACIQRLVPECKAE